MSAMDIEPGDRVLLHATNERTGETRKVLDSEGRSVNLLVLAQTEEDADRRQQVVDAVYWTADEVLLS